MSARVPVTAGVVWAHVRESLSRVGGDDLAALAGHLVLLDLPFEVLEPPELREVIRRIGTRLLDGHP